ncbi:MAG: hypothetical protein AB1641_08595 [Thermodesulfobacteriota bacterium]
MLAIKTIMNSPVADIFAFKTCCGTRAFDQNLEILLTNEGDEPVTVPSRFHLEGESWSGSIETLMPHGDQVIEPRVTIAFYCAMDEDRWTQARRLIFFDGRGNNYPVDLKTERAEE